MTTATIRPARAGDAATIHALILGIAEYEKLSSEVVSTPESIRESLFGARPAAEVLLAELGGEAVGFALFFPNYSTFLGRPGIYLEDIFVKTEHRRLGIGKSLFLAVARLAHERGCGRVEWTVLDWNTDAIAFYESKGARVMNDWRLVRLDAVGIENLAESEQ